MATTACSTHATLRCAEYGTFHRNYPRPEECVQCRSALWRLAAAYRRFRELQRSYPLAHVSAKTETRFFLHSSHSYRRAQEQVLIQKTYRSFRSKQTSVALSCHFRADQEKLAWPTGP